MPDATSTRCALDRLMSCWSGLNTEVNYINKISAENLE